MGAAREGWGLLTWEEEGEQRSKKRNKVADVKISMNKNREKMHAERIPPGSRLRLVVTSLYTGRNGTKGSRKARSGLNYKYGGVGAGVPAAATTNNLSQTDRQSGGRQDARFDYREQDQRRSNGAQYCRHFRQGGSGEDSGLQANQQRSKSDLPSEFKICPRGDGLEQKVGACREINKENVQLEVSFGKGEPAVPTRKQLSTRSLGTAVVNGVRSVPPPLLAPRTTTSSTTAHASGCPSSPPSTTQTSSPAENLVTSSRSSTSPTETVSLDAAMAPVLTRNRKY
ncbi:unnamed protein product [Calypogeia fissa]